jgi:hypothetical protein
LCLLLVWGCNTQKENARLESLPTIKSRNLIKGDSSAETESRTLTKGTYGMSEYAWDEKTAYDGQKSIKLSQYPGAPRIKWYFKPARASTMPVYNLEFGKPYTFSFYAKASKDNVKGYIGVQQYKWKNWFEKTIILTKNWKRYSITIVPEKKFKGKGHNKYVLSFGVIQNADAWFDAFQFEKGKKSTPYYNASAASTGVVVHSKTKNTFLKDEECLIDLNVKKARGDCPAKLKLTCKIKDYSGKTIQEKEYSVDFDSNDFYRQQIKFEPEKTGWFRVSVKASEKKGAIHKHFADLVIVQKPVEISKGITPFCGLGSDVFPAMKKIGVKWVEEWIYWKDNEKKKGEYTWNVKHRPDISLDKRIKDIKDMGFRLKILIEQFPEWTKNKKDIEGAAKLGKRYPERLLPDRKHFPDWKRYIKNLTARYKDYIDCYEIGGEVDAKYGLNPYYKEKYKDSLIGRFAGGQLIDDFAEMTKIAAQEIKRQVPNAEIGAVRPCDVDCSSYNHTMPFTTAVYKICGKYLNCLPLDCYPRPRYIGINYPTPGSAKDLKAVFKRAKEILDEYATGNKKFFVSEYGVFIDNRIIYDYKYTTEHLNCVARTYLTARALGSEFFYWYNSTHAPNTGESEWHYTGIWFRDEPLPAVAAYSAVAQIVENVVKAKLIEVNSNISVTVFKKDNGSAQMGLWTDERPSGLLLANTDGKVVLTDVMGNTFVPKTKKGYKYLPLNGSPVYLTLTGTDNNYEAALKLLKQSEVDIKTPVSLAFRESTLKKGKLYIKNKSLNTPCSGKVQYSLSGINKTKQFDAPAGSKYIMDIELPAEIPEKTELTGKILFEGFEKETFNFPVHQIAVAPELKKTPEIKSNPSSWGVKPVIKMDTRFYLFPHDPHTPWTDPNDLSADIYMGWKGKYLYLGANVKDDKHFNKYTSALYKADSFQFAFDPKNNASIIKGKDYSGDDIEMGIGLTPEGGKLETYVASDKDINNNTLYSATRNEETKTTTYVIRLPLKKLGLAPGKVFGFNTVVFDDDTGAGQSYHIRYTRGITGGKNPKLFKKFVLKK